MPLCVGLNGAKLIKSLIWLKAERFINTVAVDGYNLVRGPGKNLDVRVKRRLAQLR